LIEKLRRKIGENDNIWIIEGNVLELQLPGKAF
jgi:hypothetical protein